MLVLDESNFEKTLAENDVLMLEFFAPWCGNCQRLRPRYARAAAALASEGSKARLAKVRVVVVVVVIRELQWHEWREIGNGLLLHVEYALSAHHLNSKSCRYGG